MSAPARKVVHSDIKPDNPPERRQGGGGEGLSSSARGGNSTSSALGRNASKPPR